MFRKSACALTVAAVLIAGTIGAGEGAEVKSYPYISGEVAIEVQNDWTYRSDDGDTELNDLFTKTEPVVVLHITPELSLLVHGVLEPVRAPGPRDNRVFEDQGLLVEELHLTYATEWFSVFGGKFTPNFGLGWDAAPGVYGTDFAEDGYEFAEQIGLGATVTFKDKRLGAHTLSASTFFADTTVLSESAINNRGRTSLSSGGAGNTEDLSSFAVALDGEEIPALPGFGYHIAFVHRAEGRGNTADETGIAIAVKYSFSVAGVEVSPFIEYVHFDDLAGTDGDERDFFTTSLHMVWKQWNLAVSRTGRDTDIAGGSDSNDQLVQISAGYAFDSGLGIDVGWKFTEEAGIDSDTFGVLIAYTITF